MQRDGKNLEEEPIHLQQKYFFSEIYIKKKKHVACISTANRWVSSLMDFFTQDGEGFDTNPW